MPGVKGRSGGRNAKTAQQLKVAGTFRGDRHAGRETPEPPEGHPRPPKKLEGDARKEWDRMVSRLEQSRTLTVVDDAALYQYCRLFAETEETLVDLERCRESIDKLHEALDESDLKGGDLVNAFTAIAKMSGDVKGYATQVRQGRMALRTYLVEFGLTPAARSRVKVVSTKHDEPKASPLASLQGRARALRAVK